MSLDLTTLIKVLPFDKKKDGFVGKESDTKKNSKGQLVWICLFQRSLGGKNRGKPFKFKVVELWSPDAQKRIAKLRFVYHWPEDKKPQRQVWRSEIPPKKLPLNVILRYDGFYSILPNPRKRID